MRRYSLAQFLRSRIVFFVGIALCIFIALNFVKVFSKSYSTRQDIKRLKDEIGKLEKNQQRLDEFYSLLSSDFFAEKEARLKFGLQRQGEHAIVIQENGASIERSESQKDSSNDSKSQNTLLVSDSDVGRKDAGKQNNPKIWWDYFFSIRE